MLALSPRHLLDFDPTLRAVHTPHRVGELHWNVPDWHELEQSRLNHPVVTRAGLPAARTLQFAAVTCSYFGNDSWMFGASDHFDIRINETLDLMNTIE